MGLLPSVNLRVIFLRHKSNLRARSDRFSNAEPLQAVLPEVRLETPLIDLSALPEGSRDAELRWQTHAEGAIGFQETLDRASLHTRGDGKAITCVVFHHGQPSPGPTHLADISEILDETHQRVRAVHERWRPELAAIQSDQVQRIRAILSEEQKPEYEKWRAEREKKRGKR